MARDRLTSDEMTYERLPGETSKAFSAFVMYRDMGADRTLENVRLSLGKPSGYYRQLQYWSDSYGWKERARLFDNDLDRKQRESAERNIPRWEQLRQESLQANIELARKLRERIESMIDHPLTKERVEVGVNGRSTTWIVPANWTWGSIATVVKTMAELEAGTIAEGLLDEEADAFDASTATLEACREFIERQRKRTKVRPGTD